MHTSRLREFLFIRKTKPRGSILIFRSRSSVRGQHACSFTVHIYISIITFTTIIQPAHSKMTSRKYKIPSLARTGIAAAAMASTGLMNGARQTQEVSRVPNWGQFQDMCGVEPVKDVHLSVAQQNVRQAVQDQKICLSQHVNDKSTLTKSEYKELLKREYMFHQHLHHVAERNGHQIVHKASEEGENRNLAEVERSAYLTELRKNMDDNDTWENYWQQRRDRDRVDENDQYSTRRWYKNSHKDSGQDEGDGWGLPPMDIGSIDLENEEEKKHRLTRHRLEMEKIYGIDYKESQGDGLGMGPIKVGSTDNHRPTVSLQEMDEINGIFMQIWFSICKDKYGSYKSDAFKDEDNMKKLAQGVYEYIEGLHTHNRALRQDLFLYADKSYNKFTEFLTSQYNTSKR